MSEHQESVTESQRAPPSVRGRRLKRIGATIFWSALVLSTLAYPLGRVMGYAVFAVVAALMACLFGGIAIMRRGRKLMAAGGEAVLAADPRAPVVYLRPFAADAVGTGVATRTMGYRYFTEEEQLAMVMNEIGPFVAIGDPRESIADLGAARIYAREGGWQHKVSDLVSRARLVILRAGTSEGFWYELQAVHTSVPPARVLLLVPADRTEYSAFRERAREVLPHPLPETLDLGARTVLGNVGAVIEFVDDWRPRALPVMRSFKRAIFTAPYAARLKLTLRPVFERLGVPWSPPPVARARMALLVTASVIGVFFFAIWALIKLPEWTYDPSEDLAYSDSYAERPGNPDTLAVETIEPATVEYSTVPGTAASLSAYDHALADLSARYEEVPELAAALANATSREEARGIGRELSRRGLHRLSDERLLERAMVMNQILALADVQTCSSLLTGSPGGAMDSVLRQLAAEDVNRFFDLSFQAMVAEARQEVGPPLPSEEEVYAALETLLQGLPGEDGQRLVTVLSNPQQATDEDGCGAARSLYAGLVELPEPQRAILARGLVIPD
jgi:hypothetical protein